MVLTLAHLQTPLYHTLYTPPCRSLPPCQGQVPFQEFPPIHVRQAGASRCHAKVVLVLCACACLLSRSPISASFDLHQSLYPPKQPGEYSVELSNRPALAQYTPISLHHQPHQGLCVAGADGRHSSRSGPQVANLDPSKSPSTYPLRSSNWLRVRDQPHRYFSSPSQGHGTAINPIL